MRSFEMTFLAIQAPDLSPSQRYRYEQYLPYFKNVNIFTNYEWVVSRQETKELYGRSGLKKALLGARALTRRTASLAKGVFNPPDVYFVQREAFFVGPHVVERLAKRMAPVIYDFDDAIWLPAISEANRMFSFLKFFEKIPKIIGLADVVLAGNAYLAEFANRFSKNVIIVPTVIDTTRYVPSPKKREGPVVIGWSGSPTTLQHFKRAMPVLERVQQRYGNRVQFVLSGDPSFECQALNLDSRAWSSATEVQTVQSFDIGIMPLPDDEWSRGKCGLKALTYMSCEVPTVMSPVGVNADIADKGNYALCPNTDDEWFEALSALVENEDLRRKLGKAGRERVVSEYSIEKWAPEVERIIRATARVN